MTFSIDVRTGDAPDIHSFLEQRIYEFNAAATGYRDAESFHAVHRDESGEIVAGICGYTWGACCYVGYLWVSAPVRGQGLGSTLLQAVERHAREKACYLVWLSTHSFQAPAFYAQHGYEQIAHIEGYPQKHGSLLFMKHLS